MPTITDEKSTPKTLTKSGDVPESRMGNARDVQDRVGLLIQADRAGRSQRRARVKGLVDGNPPYREADLRNAGALERCNVNWRTAESYLGNARSAFYDVFSEVPTYCTVRTKEGGTANQEKWSRIINEEFDKLLKSDACFDYHQQISQFEMCLYGCGPVMFEDTTDWRHTSVLHRNLLVPEMAASDANQWDECAILVEYEAHKLYKFIRNAEMAGKLGWKVEAVKQALIKASEKTTEGGNYASWEWHQQQLKNNSFQYSARSKVVQTAHYFVREFPKDDEDDGRITHAIVLISHIDESEKERQFLFQHVGRFANWREIIHPMYIDNDGGGYHHSVSGLGVKMYSPMEFQNRLLCNMADKAFAPKILFKPTTAQANEVMSIAHMGDYGKVPQGWDAMQIPVGSFMEELLVFNRELSGMISSNLAAYRSNLSKDTGNPITAYEANLRASDQSRLSKTQLNHYFSQEDWLYEEKYRRAANADNKNLPGGKAAVEFQERCEERGVPLSALKNVESVKATRVIGQGSPFLRQTVMRELLGSSALNPSSGGKMAILQDYYAALGGQVMVPRYLPEIVDFHATDQKAIATLQVSAARNGVPPVFSPNQDHMVFAETFFEAIGTAFQSLQQGADPQQVYSFVDALGGALKQHIDAIGQDPRNKKIAAEMERQWKQVATMLDKLGQQIQQQQQQRAEQQQMRQRAAQMNGGGDPEMQIKAIETKGKLALQKAKNDQAMRIKAEKHAQDLALADSRTASEITNQAVKTQAEIANAEKKVGAAESTE